MTDNELAEGAICKDFLQIQNGYEERAFVLLRRSIFQTLSGKSQTVSAEMVAGRKSFCASNSEYTQANRERKMSKWHKMYLTPFRSPKCFGRYY